MPIKFVQEEVEKFLVKKPPEVLCITGGSNEHTKNIAENAKLALQRIAKESKMNAQRVNMYI